MDKITFYEALTKKLTDLGVPEAYIGRHLKQFDQYFEHKNDEEVAAEIARLGDLDRVASRMKRMTDQLILEEQKAASDAVTDPCDGEKEPIPSADATEAHEKASDAAVVDGNTDNKAADERVIDLGFDAPEEPKEEVLNELFPDDDDMSFLPVESKDSMLTDYNSGDSLESVHVDPEALKRKRRKFWCLFFVTSPIWLAALAATAAFFALTYFVMALLIIASVAVLIATTAAGTLVSLFGLIFGVAEMISCLPVGLYECGLAIMIGALTMFVSILVYNFAVRLIPFAGKWLLVFVKFVFRKYKELFVYLKKECIGL